MRFKPALLFCAAFALGSALTGAVFAADPLLDDASSNLVKAEAQLRAATVPPRAQDHVRQAIDSIKNAERQVQRAKRAGG